MGRTIMMLGAALVVVGLLMTYGGRFFDLGNLPGDFHYRGDNFQVSFPLMSSVVVSVVLTIIANLFFR